jgi:hypothetical protein
MPYKLIALGMTASLSTTQLRADTLELADGTLLEGLIRA